MVGTERHGVWRYTLSDEREVVSAVQFGAERGLRFGKLAEAVVAGHPDGSMLVSTRNGIYRLVSEGFIEIDLGRLDELSGHVVGDDLLKGLIRECLVCLRRTEVLLARDVGEEFVVVLPGANLAIAQSLATAIRLRVERSSLGGTAAIGVSSAVPDADTHLRELFSCADEALYAVERVCRNRICGQTETGGKGYSG